METILIVLVGVIMAILLVGIALLFYDEAGRGRQVRARPAMGVGQTFAPGLLGVRRKPNRRSSPASLTVKPLPSRRSGAVLGRPAKKGDKRGIGPAAGGLSSGF